MAGNGKWMDSLFRNALHQWKIIDINIYLFLFYQLIIFHPTSQVGWRGLAHTIFIYTKVYVCIILHIELMEEFNAVSFFFLNYLSKAHWVFTGPHRTEVNPVSVEDTVH